VFESDWEEILDWFSPSMALKVHPVFVRYQSLGLLQFGDASYLLSSFALVVLGLYR
jgi:hypothetical protein